MARNVLVGPVAGWFSQRYLTSWRASGQCLCFGPEGDGGIDLVLPDSATLDDLLRQLPGDWRPEAVLLYLPYRALPAWVMTSPWPVIAMAADWNWLWESYRHLLPFCDVIFADRQGVEALQQVGINSARRACLFGGSDGWLPVTAASEPRDIDVLFVGNLQPAVQRGRLPVVAALAQLPRRYRVVIRSGVPFEEYGQLLSRSRVVLNPSVRGEWNQRVCEATFRGALLALESNNQEVFEVLRLDQECVGFDVDNFENDLVGKLTAILDDEPRRMQMVRAAQERLGQAAYERMLRAALEALEPEWSEILQRRSERPAAAKESQRRWRAVSQIHSAGSDPALVADVLQSFRFDSADAHAVNELALLLAQDSKRPGAVDAALRLWQQGLTRWPGHAVLAYNAVRTLLQANQGDAVLNLARQAIRTLHGMPSSDTTLSEGLLWPPVYDETRVEWERAGWEHLQDSLACSQARRRVLLWYLHQLVGDLTAGEVAPYYESVLARADLPRGRAALGCALARSGHLSEAGVHLRLALAGNPFDNRAATALAQTLGDTQQNQERELLAERRRLLHRAAPDLVPLESWFAGGTSPHGDELASIIILCWNQLEFTRACLESVLTFTRAPYELILVDNGSTDGTPAFLEELKRRSEPARVVVVRNEQNRGFGAGCNQGIAAAQGRYLVFLNNDTVVTPGWLQGLVALSNFDWPRVGMTGAVSNAATPEQSISTAYGDINEMLAFAQEHAKRHAGQALELDRLSGFCLLARREVLDQVGGFDERFGLAFFEDDDLCLRARRAGFRLLVAQDVFVHHFGSRSVQALGIHPAEQLRANHARFLEKWGDDTPQGYRNAHFTPLGTTPPASTQPADNVFSRWGLPSEGDHNAAFSGFTFDVSALATEPARVSLCIIAKNEESNLRACIEPVRHLFHEVVVNDTGSSDGTVALARELGGRVVEHPWEDHFSRARNQVVEAATGEWIFWLDADDRVDAENARKLQHLFAHLTPAMRGYALTCRCLSSEGGETDVTHMRLFPRHPAVRWQHRVHEQILPAIRAQGGDVVFTDIVVTHVGYTDRDLRSRKLDRDLRLLLLEREELGDHPFTLFNLGCVYLERDNHIAALPLFELSLARSHPRDSIVRKLYAQVARCRWHLGQRPGAMQACRDGLGHYPQDEELLFLLAQYHQESSELEPARIAYHRLIEGDREGSHFGSTATGLRGFRAMNNLALVYQSLGDPAQAEVWFRRAVQDHPGFISGWLALGELLATQRRWRDAEAVFARAAQLVPGDAQIQARLEAARRAGRQ